MNTVGHQSGERGGGAVWTVAEHAGGSLSPISYELLAWGRRLTQGLAAAGRQGAELCSVVLGGSLERSQLRELILRGADKVYVAQSPAFEHALVEPCAGALEHLIRRHMPEIVVAGATTFGRTLMPYVAVRIPTGLTADCTDLDIDAQTGDLVQTRPAVGGNVLATILTGRHRPQMATVRPRSEAPPARVEGRTGRIVDAQVPNELLTSRTEWLAMRGFPDNEESIQEAEKIVSGGRGLRKAENFAVVRELAGALGAAVGASRDAVDRGWAPYPHQVGLSGKTVSPRLYVAVGISGAIQHLAGMRTAGCVVAINSDPEAQMLQAADLSVVGDLFEVVPALIEEIRRRKANKERPG
jgi:electron transfer flavoprotein alpha subunit